MLASSLRLLVPVLIATAAGLGLWQPAVAEEALRTPAGYVIALETSAADRDAAAHILREGQEIPIQIGGPLFAGDAVVVREPGTAVEIETARDRHMRVDAAHSPHPIAGALPTGGRFSTLAAMIGELFQGKPDGRTVNLIGRTDAELRIVIGRAVPQRVVPGSRLWVSWQGGVAPFSVEIHAAGNGEGKSTGEVRAPAALASTRTQDHVTHLLLPREASGPLVLEVRDGDGARAEIALRAETTPPAIPAWISEGAPTPEFAKVASALWLLDQKPPDRDLYAASLAADAGRYRAAEELLRRLADGKRPPR